MLRRWLTLIVFCAPVAASGQTDPYQELPEKVEVADLVRSPSMYNGKAVIVIGNLRVGDFEDLQADIHRLRDRNGFQEVRVGQSRMGSGDLRYLDGQDVEVNGIFWDLAQECYRDPMVGLRCYDNRLREFAALREDWEREENRYFIGVLAAAPIEGEPLREKLEPEEKEEPDVDIPPGDLVDLRELVKNPQVYLDRRLSVVGKFRGNDLYGDLSFKTKKTPRDFVIKVADAAIWVTGKQPRGKGFDLNPRTRRDTGEWLKVTGIPWMANDIVYLRAEKLELVSAPEDPALEPVKIEEKEEDESPAPPPEVNFSLPLDGEAGIPLTTEFHVQFSSDMNEESFRRNVDLLYADDDGTGNPFPKMEIRYDSGNRTLIIVPGSDLLPGKEIRLILYEGIVDEEGQPLVVDPHAGEEVPAAVLILRFTTAGRSPADPKADAASETLVKPREARRSCAVPCPCTSPRPRGG